MLDIRRLRTDFDSVADALARRGDDLDPALAQAVDLDARQRDLAAERDDVRARIKVAVQAGGLPAGPGPTATRPRRWPTRAASWAVREQVARGASEQVAAELRELLLRIPNIPAADAPDGAGEADNVVVRVEDFDPDAYQDHQRVPHWDIGDELGILDLERGAKISGSMFVLFRGAGRHAEPGAVPAGPRPQRRPVRGDPPADAWC